MSAMTHGLSVCFPVHNSQRADTSPVSHKLCDASAQLHGGNLVLGDHTSGCVSADCSGEVTHGSSALRSGSVHQDWWKEVEVCRVGAGWRERLVP